MNHLTLYEKVSKLQSLNVIEINELVNVLVECVSNLSRMGVLIMFLSNEASGVFINKTRQNKHHASNYNTQSKSGDGSTMGYEFK